MKPDKTGWIDDVMSGRSKNIAARVARTGLRTLEPVYRTVTHFRNRSYDRSRNQVRRIGVPVISIGNLTTGGTGKTPMVRWVSESLCLSNERPVIVSRGYGSKAGHPNDEYLELKLYLPQTPHIQDPDRIAASKLAVEKYQASVIVLDDGFQHRRIARDLDIVLVDATRPFGHGHLLPRGLLREPLHSLERANAVVITRVNQVSVERVAEITSRITRYIEESKIATVSFVPSGWIDINANRCDLEENSVVAGFCGIGNPESFQRSLKALFHQVVEFVAFADHHPYSQYDLERLQTTARSKNADQLVCTVKDLVKIRNLRPGPVQVLATTILTKFESGEMMLKQMVHQALQSVSRE